MQPGVEGQSPGGTGGTGVRGEGWSQQADYMAGDWSLPHGLGMTRQMAQGQREHTREGARPGCSRGAGWSSVNSPHTETSTGVCTHIHTQTSYIP